MIKRIREKHRTLNEKLEKQRDREAIQDDASLFFSVVHFYNIQR